MRIIKENIALVHIFLGLKDAGEFKIIELLLLLLAGARVVSNILWPEDLKLNKHAVLFL